MGFRLVGGGVAKVLGASLNGKSRYGKLPVLGNGCNHFTFRCFRVIQRDNHLAKRYLAGLQTIYLTQGGFDMLDTGVAVHAVNVE